jgi:hypothetical protein
MIQSENQNQIVILILNEIQFVTEIQIVIQIQTLI